MWWKTTERLPQWTCQNIQTSPIEIYFHGNPWARVIQCGPFYRSLRRKDPRHAKVIVNQWCFRKEMVFPMDDRFKLRSVAKCLQDWRQWKVESFSFHTCELCVQGQDQAGILHCYGPVGLVVVEWAPTLWDDHEKIHPYNSIDTHRYYIPIISQHIPW